MRKPGGRGSGPATATSPAIRPGPGVTAALSVLSSASATADNAAIAVQIQQGKFVLVYPRDVSGAQAGKLIYPLAPWRSLLLFLFAGALANIAAAWSLDHPTSIIIGASGAVSAIIGAYLALFPRARLGLVLPLGLFLEFVRTPASLLIGIWALLQLLFTFIGPAFGPVAWWAHVTGFMLGVVFALLSRPAIARRLRQG